MHHTHTLHIIEEFVSKHITIKLTLSLGLRITIILVKPEHH